MDCRLYHIHNKKLIHAMRERGLVSIRPQVHKCEERVNLGLGRP